LFHGLNGQPSLWNDHVVRLSKHDGLDVFVPEIPQAGNCHIEGDAFHKLLDRIVNWTIRNPLKPVAFFGQSNGSRVATRFEIWLRKSAPTTPVFVSLTGAVLFGSKTIEMLTGAISLGTVSAFMPGYNVYQDLNYGSEPAKNLLRDIREPLARNVAKRYYAMYTPFHDHHVHSLGSALPIINPDKQESKEEHHYIVFNYGHNAIPTALVEQQISEYLKWMKNLSDYRQLILPLRLVPFETSVFPARKADWRLSDEEETI
jgi:hypothetical protein